MAMKQLAKDLQGVEQWEIPPALQLKLFSTAAIQSLSGGICPPPFAVWLLKALPPQDVNPPACFPLREC